MRGISFYSALAGVALLLLARSEAVLAQQLVLVANSGVQISASDVADVFLGEKQFAGAAKLVPVDNGPVQELFLRQVLNMNGVTYYTKWAKKSFRDGISPPSVRSGDAEVIEFVKHTPGAVGYVTNVPAGVTVIRRY